MRNMFSGNVQKEIPKSLGDCIKPDSVSSNLWVWCERLEKLGEILFWLLIIGGLIFSIGASIVEKEVVVKEATYWREAETEIKKVFNIEIFVPLLTEIALYAFIEYCTYHIVALLIGALASIVQHTKITAEIALYNVQNNKTKEKPIAKVQNNIKNTTITEDNSIVTNGISNMDTKPNVIICSECGFEQPSGRAMCWKCGVRFKENDKGDIHHQWRCDGCGNLRTQTPCEYCGKE